jgi:crotonobetainyl-CoA:carnitine CoA-transferase CaiB-like acyl-CoA transferase
VTVDAQPLGGILVVELAWYLPIAFAGSELARLGARVVRIEAPEGDQLRQTAPAWDRVLRSGKESVACDLKTDAGFAQGLCARADVVLEGLRPGVAARLGVGPDDLPASVVHCSITGFGHEGGHVLRAGHDLNYLGWAGALEDVPSCPPLPIADLAAGGLGAVTEVLAALVRRARTGEGARLRVSMTHRSHAFVAHRLGGDPGDRLLTGGLACYRVYATADGRHLTLAALEPKFFARVCALLARPELAEKQYGEDQKALAGELATAFGARTLAAWLALFDGEDVCVGPVATRAEAAAAFGSPLDGDDVPLGHHTAAWRAEIVSTEGG